MGKNIGFRLGHKVVRVFKWCIRRRTRRSTRTYRRLDQPAGPVSKLCRWVGFFKHRAKGLVSGKSTTNSGYIRIGRDPPVKPKLPKGHLAVYVGDKEDETSRVVVPVLYFNHPLFCELLREAETAYGFDHKGGIKIPCRRSEWENIQAKIAATTGGGSWPRRRR